MSNFKLADFAEYTEAFKTKYERDTTLTVDDLEKIIDNAEADMTAEDIAEAMLEAETPEGSEADRSVPEVIESGSAWEYAKKLVDPEFQEHLEKNAQAALENKRGAAVIRRDLVRLFTLETIERVWPIPGSTAKTHPGSNRALHKYPKIVKDADGQDKLLPEGGDWYFDLWDGSPEGQEHNKKVVSLKAVKNGETGKHVLPEHSKLIGDDIKLLAAKSALDGFRTNKKNAIIRAVNIVQRMARINEETEATVQLITDDGKPEGIPVQSNKLVYLFNSKDVTKFKVLTIGQMLALSVDKAKAAGGTYVNLISTTGRKPGGTETTAQNVKVENVKQLDDVSAATATYFASLRNDAKAMNAFLTHLNAKGSEDFLLSLNSIMTDIDSNLSKPGLARKLADALASEKTKAA